MTRPMTKMTQDEVIKANCLPVPLHVFDNAPAMLRKAIVPALDMDEGQMKNPSMTAQFMGALCNFSTLMPTVRVFYGKREHSVNVCFLWASDAGSGKSDLNFSARIMARVNEFVLNQSLMRIDEWEGKKMKWEAECKRAAKANESPDMSLKPEPCPTLAMICVPSTISKSQLLHVMEATQKYGVILQSSELLSLVDCLGKEYAGFADVLTKATENESDSQYFKVDGRPIDIKFAMLSYVFASNIATAQKMFPNIIDGLASRHFTLLSVGDDEWKSQRPKKNVRNYEAIYDDLAQEAFHMWQLILSHPMEVEFTDSQWDKHDSIWGEAKAKVIAEAGSSHGALVNRHGQNAMRMAATLTVLRWWDGVKESYIHHGADFDHASVPHTLTCSDTDFDNAMSVATALLTHSLCFATSQTHSLAHPVSGWEWTESVLAKCPERFTGPEFTALAEAEGKSTSTAYNTLAKLEKMGRIKIAGKGKCNSKIFKKVVAKQ